MGVKIDYEKRISGLKIDNVNQGELLHQLSWELNKGVEWGK